MLGGYQIPQDSVVYASKLNSFKIRSYASKGVYVLEASTCVQEAVLLFKQDFQVNVLAL